MIRRNITRATVLQLQARRFLGQMDSMVKAWQSVGGVRMPATTACRRGCRNTFDLTMPHMPQWQALSCTG